MRWALPFAGSILMLLTAASSPHYAGHWLVVGSTASGAEMAFTKKEPISIARLVPLKLLRLDQDAHIPRDNILAVPAGRLMIPVDDQGRKLCDLERHRGSAFACLADTDNDGRFDTYFGVQVFKEYFFGSVGGDESQESLRLPVTASAASPVQDAPVIPIEFLYVGNSTDGKFRYKICTSKTSEQKVVFGRVDGDKHLSRYCFGETRSAIIGTPFDVIGVQIMPIKLAGNLLIARVTPGERPAEFTTYSNYR